MICEHSDFCRSDPLDTPIDTCFVVCRHANMACLDMPGRPCITWRNTYLFLMFSGVSISNTP